MDKKQLLDRIEAARQALAEAAASVPKRIVDAPLTETRRWKATLDKAAADYHFKNAPSPNTSLPKLEQILNKLNFYKENLA